MTAPDESRRDAELRERVTAGDEEAARELLVRSRPRLCRMVAVHLDGRISARVDSSDVVQEAMAEAIQRIPEYVARPTISLYPWLRQIAWQRLIKLHRTHLATASRDVGREISQHVTSSEDSLQRLAHQLASNGTGPAQAVVKKELRQRVRTALDELGESDRTLLVMRYLEHVSLREISEIMEITLAAARKRHTRAIERLERLLTDGV